MRFISLASSSKANCYIVEHEGAALMIDAGLRKRDMLAKWFKKTHPTAEPGEISAALHIPVYCTNDTLEAAPASLLGKADQVVTLTVGIDTYIDKFAVHPVTTYHTPGSVGFWIAAGGRTVSVFTDVAGLSGGVAQALERSHLAAIEANYSTAMLDACEYDPGLKRRIRLAHTSNENLAALFSNGFKGEALHTVVLLHTSRKANCGFVALATIEEALHKQFPGRSLTIDAAELDEVTGPFEV